ncbi:RNA polymerase subunit sigma-70 [Streptomyces sp. NPDC051976]|uniref:RNA polymerase subunit sigma-70 n=1 Tax=Streptomyces sp. NPDC051976 TaxID=3154947 RepID=UPI0034478DE1
MPQQTVARPGGAGGGGYAGLGPYGPAGPGFAALTGPYRRELLAHCYRLLGSVDDAQDLVQETYLRAWRSYDGFQGRPSIRGWLYRIATRACLDALRHGSRRRLPSGRAGSAGGVPQPIPDILVVTASGDPEAMAVPARSLRLALVTGLQRLPGRQRAVLLLRDVLDFPATEAAAILGISVPAAKSALQRARANLHAAAPGWENEPPPRPRGRALLDQFVAAVETRDADALQRLLPPSSPWFTGLPEPGEGDWRLLPTSANGQHAAAAYLRAPDTTHHGIGILVLTTTATAITRLTPFPDPALLPAFDLPLRLP